MPACRTLKSKYRRTGDPDYENRIQQALKGIGDGEYKSFKDAAAGENVSSSSSLCILYWFKYIYLKGSSFYFERPCKRQAQKLERCMRKTAAPHSWWGRHFAWLVQTSSLNGETTEWCRNSSTSDTNFGETGWTQVAEEVSMPPSTSHGSASLQTWSKTGKEL